MAPDRRSFLHLSAVAGGALATRSLAPALLSAEGERPGPAGNPPPAPRALSLLILGGTGFTGPHQVRYAVARGHRVTVFNRGRTQAELPSGVEQLVGDRNLGELDALKGRSWDAVIDNPTTLPFWVRDAGQVLSEATGHYVFIPTISAFQARARDPIDEESPTLRYTDSDPLEVTPEILQARGAALYGPMKAESEREATRWFGDRTTIIRPGLIVGPRARMSVAEQLHGIRGALSGDLDVRFTWVPAEFLQEQDVRPWMEMTTWFGVDALLSQVSTLKAVTAGLSYRSLAITANDTLEWFRGLPDERRAQPRAGLAPEKEWTVLAAWHAASSAS